jgi:hypothetical protein
MDAKGYVQAKMPFFVVETQVDNRVEGGDFRDVISVSAMDKKKGVTTEPEFDPSKPKMCKECETRLCDCMYVYSIFQTKCHRSKLTRNRIRPCDPQFCNVCIRTLDDGGEFSDHKKRNWKCPTCSMKVGHVAGFSGPMNLSGEEALKVKVPVHVLKIEHGRVQFQSIHKTRI